MNWGQDSLNPPYNSGSETDRRKVVSCQPVVAGRDTPEVLQPLNAVPPPFSRPRWPLRKSRRQGPTGDDRQRLMLQNLLTFRSRLCKRLGLKHIRTKPYTPKTNGKAERFIQTCLREWAYAQAYHHSRQRAGELPYWLHRYNWHRPHAGIANHHGSRHRSRAAEPSSRNNAWSSRMGSILPSDCLIVSPQALCLERLYGPKRRRTLNAKVFDSGGIDRCVVCGIRRRDGAGQGAWCWCGRRGFAVLERLESPGLRRPN